MLAFTAGRLLTPTDPVEHPLVLVEQGRVHEISARSSRQVPTGISACDFGDGVIAPGYVDLHIHGSAGYDVMDDTSEALPAIEQLLARHGVTSYFPTTVTAPMDTTLRALERLADAIEKRETERERTNGTGSCGPFRWESILKGHSSAMRVEGCTRRKIYWFRRWPCSSSSGRRRAAGFA